MKALLIIAALAASSPAYSQSITVWTHTDTFTSQDQANRQRVVQDTIKRLSKHFTISPDAAISVEVRGTERSEERDQMAVLGNMLGGRRQSEKQMVTWRLATLTVGDYSTELRVKGSLASAVERWIKMNKATLDAQ